VNWLLKKGVQAVDNHEIRLLRMLRDGIQAIDGVTMHCQDDLENHIAVLSFNVDGLEAGDTGTMLDVDYDIACRTGLHCAPLVHEQLGTDRVKGSVRFGIGPFNTEEEISTAVGAVREIVASRKRHVVTA
jgi:cysteine desulfurase/selenocysteine lyase